MESSSETCTCRHRPALHPVAFPTSFQSIFCWSFHRLQWRKRCSRVWATDLPPPPRTVDVGWGQCFGHCQLRLCICSLVPWPLISRDFTLTEMVSLIQIEIVKKWGERAWRHHSTKNSNYLLRVELLGGISLHHLSQCWAFFKEFHHMGAYCSLNPKLIRIIASLTRSLSLTLKHKFCLTCLVPHINCDSFTPNSSFRANLAHPMMLKFSLGWPMYFVWRDVSRLSHNFIPLKHYSLFVTSIFILMQLRAWCKATVSACCSTVGQAPRG